MTFPGASNITLNNDNGAGFDINIAAHWGTDYTISSGFSYDTWNTFNGSSRYNDFPQNWVATSGATFEATGLQLEVGDVATDFEHRSYSDELKRCERYFQKIDIQFGSGMSNLKPFYYTNVPFKTEMRIAPALDDNTNYNSDSGDLQTITAGDYTTWVDGCTLDFTTTSGVTIHGGSSNTYHWLRGRVHLGSEL